MRIRISEVWNHTGKVQELVVIETQKNPTLAVFEWIKNNRPDLSLANTTEAHGFHAKVLTN